MAADGYDFSGLTLRQQELLTFQGWSIALGELFPQPQPRTVKKLIERGLVIRHEVERPTPIGVMTVAEYEVPIPVHMAWCAYCAKACAAEDGDV